MTRQVKLNLIIFPLKCFRYAKEVITGHDVLVSGQFELIPAKVVTVSSVHLQGIFLHIVICVSCHHSFQLM